jgi:hypothetical protein
MAGPGWLTGLLAAVMLTVAAYNATRLVAAPRWGRAAELDADGVHVVMGVAMAGMLAPGLSFAPARLWQAVFAASGMWFGYHYILTRRGRKLGSWRCPHPLPHLIECIAMVLMLALPADPSRRNSSKHHNHHHNHHNHHHRHNQLPGPLVRRLLQDRHGRHHGLHADRDAVDPEKILWLWQRSFSIN